MLIFCRDLSKNYAMELTLFRIIRKFSDGLTFCSFIIDSDWYRGDHNPQVSFRLIVLNVMLIEFMVYNINHVVTTKKP